ncbi:hypothetical protein DRO97_05075 [Archaeoglobales archaeon]|nr:MAG: hypothetical protein DRO97_05075 [Archaeoglobales archaeon]
MIKDINKIPDLLNSLEKEKEEILKKAGAFLEGAIKETITKGRPEWSPLKPETIKRKGSSKPLIDTGKLRASITHRIEGNIIKVGVFGEEALIAAVHEFGSPKKNIPQRSFIRVTADEKEKDLQKLVDEEVEKVIRRNTVRW